MAGLSLKVTIKDKDISRKLDRALEKIENPVAFYKNVGEHVIKTTVERIADEQTPDGQAWQRLSPVTLAARAKRGTGSTIYREYGDFIGTINYEASDDNLIWGSPDVRARIFQLGGKAGRGLSVTLPSREYLGLSPQDETIILEMAEDHVGL